MIGLFSSYNRKYTCLLTSSLRTNIDKQHFPFIVSFPVTKHEVQTAALRKHKSRFKIYQCKTDNYQTTDATRHNHALNFACKLKWVVNQFAVKPAAILNAVPGYCFPCCRGSKHNVLKSVEWANVFCVEGVMADCLVYGRLLIWNYYTLVWELMMLTLVRRLK